MMARLLTFCLFADPQLSVTKGIFTDAEQDRWQGSVHGEIKRRIELGQPDERRLQWACGREWNVVLINDGGAAADLRWQQNSAGLERLQNLRVLDLDPAKVQALTALVERTMEVQCTLDGNQVWIGNGRITVEFTPTVRQARSDRRAIRTSTHGAAPPRNMNPCN